MMNKMSVSLLNSILIGMIMISVFSCKNSDNVPNVSAIDVNIDFYRTELDVYTLNQREQFNEILLKYPDFYSIYLDNVLNLKRDSDSLFYDSFMGFKSDSIIQDLYKKVADKYTNMEGVRSDLKKLYQYIQYYFPDRVEVPKFYTFVADFAYQIFIFSDNGKDGIGLGLDMFMSPEINYKLINPDNTNFSDYITRSWNEDHIVQKVAQLHVADLVGDTPGHRLIDQMIHNGKMLYITQKIVPFVHDTIIHDYTLDQLDWCESNQFEIWQFFLENKLFYETNLKKISKYINPAPTSMDMPSLSPGRTANFIGLKVVESYMNRYPETTLDELISLRDSQMLMDKSRYKPRLK